MTWKKKRMLSSGLLPLLSVAVILMGCNLNGSKETLPSGSLDAAFGTDGVVIYDSGSDDQGNSLTIDANGKILVTGYTGSGLAEDMVIWRYNSSGSADSTFDADGMVVYDYTGGVNPNPDRGASITTDSSGKILVAGSDYYTDSAVNILVTWRYNVDGSPDTDFDPPNFLVNSMSEYDRSITTDSSGKILVTGYTVFLPHKMRIARYNSDSSQDDTFGGSGLVEYSSGNGNEGYSITIDANGKILVAGRGDNGSNYDMAIWRYEANGTPDTTFDTDGIAVYDGGIDNDEVGRCMTIDANGKILVTGYAYNVADTDMAIWRFNTDGSLDTSFDGDGMALYDSGGFEEGFSIATDANERILVTGFIDNGSDDDMAVWRFNTDGSLDTSFDGDGMALYDSGNTDQGRSIVLAANGRILVAGYSNNGSDDDLVIWRYVQ
jgi:uncharacterized delta-60 repeat protein